MNWDGYISSSCRYFLWLVNAGAALMVRQATEAKTPLKRTELPERFKLYQSDTGMPLSRYPQSTDRTVYLDRASQNLDGIYENAVALSAPFGPGITWSVLALALANTS